MLLPQEGPWGQGRVWGRGAQAVGPVAVTSLLLGSGLPNIADFRAPASVQDSSGAVVVYSANTPGEYADGQARCGPARLQSRGR